MPSLKSLAMLSALFASSVFANPTPAGIELGEKIPNVKRATEGLHLVNCSGPQQYSIVIYCPNDADCNHLATTNNQCFVEASGFEHWEQSGGCAFTSGTTFSWTIQSDAQNKPNYTKVGTARNPYHNYNVFKDDQHVMYTEGSGNVCRSIYYALQA
ncbi:hypothetical protein O1611_g10097 [Lasiodiplodia mahajangana]|uniref:Uncharacterized protein n=1 Tax=Lasiodiplodia mahajangana TaxID=1108764 RepID=A0ACC2J294_9PEZI|nr:hypothetical protein O1611_g10097 [Lasiodiplodia mahajangana]